MISEKRDITSEFRKHWSSDSSPARNETDMSNNSVKCDKICSNY